MRIRKVCKTCPLKIFGITSSFACLSQVNKSYCRRATLSTVLSKCTANDNIVFNNIYGSIFEISDWGIKSAVKRFKKYVKAREFKKDDIFILPK